LQWWYNQNYSFWPYNEKINWGYVPISGQISGQIDFWRLWKCQKSIGWPMSKLKNVLVSNIFINFVFLTNYFVNFAEKSQKNRRKTDFTCKNPLENLTFSKWLEKIFRWIASILFWNWTIKMCRNCDWVRAVLEKMRLCYKKLYEIGLRSLHNNSIPFIFCHFWRSFCKI
jgi:hypothetical protein